MYSAGQKNRNYKQDTIYKRQSRSKNAKYEISNYQNIKKAANQKTHNS